MVLPETNAADALRRAEEIRIAIGATTIQCVRQNVGPNTASIGVATFPADGDHPSACWRWPIRRCTAPRPMAATASRSAPGATVGHDPAIADDPAAKCDHAPRPGPFPAPV